jgi:carbon starvation protein
MSLLSIVIISAVALFVAYRVYGSYLARMLKLDPNAETPAVQMRDDLDYMPLEPRSLLSQHFSAIAAAGPIVGPILAGVMFGWLPALLWIIVGSIFIGGVHDFVALVASIRHRARSIAEVVREHMSRRSFVLFLIFVWLALDYIIVAFTDITASSFVGMIDLESGDEVSGGGIATSSVLYLILPVIMGLLLRFTRLKIGLATIIFLPLVGLSIWVGQYIPLNLDIALGISLPHAHRVWNIAILAYCFIASVVPVWSLLQPRGHLGGYFLFFTLVGGSIGLMFSGDRTVYPAFTSWVAPTGQPLFPMLFITIACGACSGFHAIIASGTTSKQLRCETDAKVIGYGAMLLEGMVAVVSLACVMRIAADSPLLTGPGGAKPNFLYALGIGSFLGVLGVPASFGVSFALMAFTTFVYDTLDVCTRLGRYIVEELTGWRTRAGKAFAAIVTVGAPLPFLLQNNVDATGAPIPVWKVFWELFGASNQLLAALTLIGVTVWLWRTRRSRTLLLVTGVPTVLMYTMSTWALVRILRAEFALHGMSAGAIAWVAVILVALAALMLIDALIVFFAPKFIPRTHRLEQMSA